MNLNITPISNLNQNPIYYLERVDLSKFTAIQNLSFSDLYAVDWNELKLLFEETFKRITSMALNSLTISIKIYRQDDIINMFEIMDEAVHLTVNSITIKICN